MKKTIKILLLAVLVVCTVCVLTVMASAADAEPVWYQVDQTEGNDNDLVWSFDETTATLTIKGESKAIVWKDGATAESSKQAMIPWVENNAQNTTIKNVVIDAPITELPKAIFARHRNLKSVTLLETCKIFRNSVFEGCYSLAEIKIGDESPANVINLSKITDVGSSAFKGAVTSGATLWMPEGNVYLRFNYGFGMSSATEYNFVVHPGSKAETDLKDWEGGSNVYGKFNISYYYQNSIVFDSWRVRTSDYNGLRGIFYADSDKLAGQYAWELKEYGAFVTSTANKTIGTEVSYDPATDTVTVPDHLKHFAIYSTNEETELGKILDSSKENNPENTYFAVTITKYTANYKTEVYMAGYEVWSNGVDYKIIYTDYGADEDHLDNFVDTSLYEMSLDMYKSGFMNAKDDPNNIVWDSLVAGGALVLNKGTGYEESVKITDEWTVSNASFDNTFTVKNVPMVNQKVVDGELRFEKSNVTYTVLDDCFNEGKYVLVFRTAENPTEGKEYIIPGSSRYTDGYWNQISPKWFDTAVSRDKYSSIDNDNLPNPVFKTDFYSKCETVIIDHGITGIAKSAFEYGYGVSYMYYDTLETLEGNVWQNAKTVERIYMKGTISEEGFADISTLGSVATGALFDGCEKITKIHMPAVGCFDSAISTAFARNTKLDTLWCGEGDGEAGVIDLSNLEKRSDGSDPYIGANAFVTSQTLSGEVTILLPAGYTIPANAYTSGKYIPVYKEDSSAKAGWSGYCVM